MTGNFHGTSTGNGLPDSSSLFYFDENEGGWVPFPETSNDETFTVGAGYSIFIMDDARHTKLITSGPLHQGDFDYSLTANPGNDADAGWNLLGNPFASPVQWNMTGWSMEDVGPAAYLLDDRYPGGRFLVWDGTVGDPEFSGLITQGQGFFVRTTGANPALKITEVAKVDTSTALLRQKKTQTVSEHLVLTLRQDELEDRAYVKFSDEGGNHFEETDAVKRKNGYFSLFTLSSDSVSLAINNLNRSFCDRSISLGLENIIPGSYTLSVAGAGLAMDTRINLSDAFTNEMVAFHPGTEYRFQVTTDEASYGNNRFQLLIPSGTLEDPVISVVENVLVSNVAYGNQWLLNGEEIEGATQSTYVPEVSGVYSVRVTVDGCSKVSEGVLITVTVTGILEERDQRILLYPNPASKSIRLQLPKDLAGTFHYSISNAVGKHVASGEVKTESGGAIIIDVGRFPSGTYFLSLSRNGRRYQGKFVVSQ